MDIKENQLFNVALFIDYENVYKTLLQAHKNVIRDGFFEKIREWCRLHDRRLVKIAVYCNFDNIDLHESYHQSLLQSYGAETIHTSNQGKNFADLQITIDVLNAMHLNNNIDEFIIMSNDKDMTPLLNNIRYNKKRASVITTGSKYNASICAFSDTQIKYEDIIALPIGNTIIDEIQDKIYKGLSSYFNNNLERYLQAKTENRPALFSHIGLEYYSNGLLRTCYLMIYEIYQCLLELKNAEKITFYTYYHKGKAYTGLFPSNRKKELLAEGLLKEEDVIDYDLKKDIYTFYEDYAK